MSDRTKVLSSHHLRRTARRYERSIQRALDGGLRGGLVSVPNAEPIVIPPWARGVRVEKAGLFQWAVVATEHRGR